MSLLVFQHHPSEGPAVLGSILQSDGWRLRPIRLYAEDAVPNGFDDIDAVVSMGGPMNVDQTKQHPWLKQEMRYLVQAHALKIPIVGVCLGAQLIAQALGGRVAKMDGPEIGWGNVKMSYLGMGDPIFTGMGQENMQFHIHGQEVTHLPPNATQLAGTGACKNQAFRVGLTTYGFQYHFEWDRRDLEVITQDPFIKEAGLSGEHIMQQADTHYENYRRLGDRLCHSIASKLFPANLRH